MPWLHFSVQITLVGKLSNNSNREKLKLKLKLKYLTFIHHSFDSFLTGSVHIVSEGRKLDKIPIIYGSLHLSFCHEIVSFPILLSWPSRPKLEGFYNFD